MTNWNKKKLAPNINTVYKRKLKYKNMRVSKLIDVAKTKQW